MCVQLDAMLPRGPWMQRNRDDGGTTRGLRVRAGLVIPKWELEVRRTRSGGPGGQNVNKVSTRVELRFDVQGSSVLTDEQKRLVRQRLAKRVSAAGVLRVVSQSHRTQSGNEREARRRLAELLRTALHTPRQRHPTRPTQMSRMRRLEEKRRRSTLKRRRRAVTGDE